MRFLQKHFVGFAVATLFTLALPVLRADEWDKRTVVTINQPIQVPHVVLIPGTYVFRLLDSPSNRDIVQIFDKNEQRLIHDSGAAQLSSDPDGKIGFHVLGNAGRQSSRGARVVLSGRQLRSGVCLSENSVDPGGGNQ